MRRPLLSIAAGAVVAAGVAVAFDANRAAGRVRSLVKALRRPPEDDVFTLDLVADQPEPVRRYFAHAISPGTPIATSVALKLTGRMRPRPDLPYLELRAREVLASPEGMVWQAETHVGPVGFSVVDSHYRGEGRLEGRLMGLLRVMGAAGPDISRSSRHRVAAEATWLPSSLLPHHGVPWEALDEGHIQCTVSVDGEPVRLQLEIDGDGRVMNQSMERYGDVGLPEFGLIPYGYDVLEEKTFDGYTIPGRVLGGWWFGTERFEPAVASEFSVESAAFL